MDQLESIDSQSYARKELEDMDFKLNELAKDCWSRQKLLMKELNINPAESLDEEPDNNKRLFQSFEGLVLGEGLPPGKKAELLG